jgi:hypothetical protein
MKAHVAQGFRNGRERPAILAKERFSRKIGRLLALGDATAANPLTEQFYWRGSVRAYFGAYGLEPAESSV